MATPPSAAPAYSDRAGRSQSRRIIAGLLAVLAVAIVVKVATSGGANCKDVPEETLSVIEGRAQGRYTPLHLTNAKAIAVTLTYPNGNKADGLLVAASTPAGVGVWATDVGAYAGGGHIQAVNTAAQTTANWRSGLPSPASDADINAAVACVPGGLSNQ